MSLRKTIQAFKNKFLGEDIEFTLKDFSVSGNLFFVGRSPLSISTGSTYITFTVGRLPIRVDERDLNLVKIILISKK